MMIRQGHPAMEGFVGDLWGGRQGAITRPEDMNPRVGCFKQYDWFLSEYGCWVRKNCYGTGCKEVCRDVEKGKRNREWEGG